MPVVVVNPEEYERFDLKSAPPDGFVMLRALPYGLKLTRRSKAMKMFMRSSPAKTQAQARNQDNVFELESMDEWATAHDFAYCIGEHNLEVAPGQLIDFQKNTLMAIKMLDPRVGAEIERYIDKLNNDEDEESLEDFLQRASTSSTDSQKELGTDGSDETGTTEPVSTIPGG